MAARTDPAAFVGLAVILAWVMVAGLASGDDSAAVRTPFRQWKNGPSSDPGYFPIAVWLQDPKNAPRFKEAGINLYVGLWKGPTESQLEALRAAGMPVICSIVWMSLIHGSRGLIYFVHQFQPKFIEAGLLADPEMLAAVTAINRQIRELAPVIHSPDLKDAARVTSSDSQVPIDIAVKRHSGAIYIFAAGMRNAPATASFEVRSLPEKAEAEVLGEDRKIAIDHGRFEDKFDRYDVHLYRIR